MFQNFLCECSLNVPMKSSTNVRYRFSLNVPIEGSGNVLFEYSLNIDAERSLNIPFQRSWNVPQEHSENIALERSKNPDIFLVLGTFLERSDGTFRTFDGNVHRTFREGIVLWGGELLISDFGFAPPSTGGNMAELSLEEIYLMFVDMGVLSR